MPLGGSDTVPEDFKQEIKGLKDKLREIGGVQLSGSVEAEAIWMRSGEHMRVTNASSNSKKSGVVGGFSASFFLFLHITSRLFVSQHSLLLPASFHLFLCILISSLLFPNISHCLSPADSYISYFSTLFFCFLRARSQTKEKEKRNLG